MVFSFYNRLTPAQKRIYRRSDQTTSFRLPSVNTLRSIVEELHQTLREEHRRETAAAAQKLVTAITIQLKVPDVRVTVMEVRPSRTWGELHGLYTLAENQKCARMTLWMRTAKRRHVVAFRTFLRTLVHELCHHLDYALLGLGDSFHTEGFYKRESSVVHQLIPSTKERSIQLKPTTPEEALPQERTGPLT